MTRHAAEEEAGPGERTASAARTPPSVVQASPFCAPAGMTAHPTADSGLPPVTRMTGGSLQGHGSCHSGKQSEPGIVPVNQ